MIPRGLNSKEVAESRQKHGANTLTQIPPDPLWKKILEGFKDPMIMILLVALIVQVVLFFLKQAEWFEPVGILIAILIANGVASISESSQESKASALKAEEEAKEMAKVIRDGSLAEIHVSEVVVGDIVFLQAGDKIPADGEIVDGTIKVDQAALNGETEEATKKPKDTADAQYDIEFIKGEYALENLRHDIGVIIDIAQSALEFGAKDILLIVLDQAEGDITKLVNLDSEHMNIVSDIIDHISDLEILNKFENELASMVMNIVANQLDVHYTFTPTDFSEIVWENEVESVKEIIVALGETLEAAQLTQLSEILSIDFNALPVTLVATSTVLEAVDVLDELFDLYFFEAIAMPFAEYGLEMVEEYGFDVAFLLDNLTGADLVEDLESIVHIVRNVVEFGAMDIAYDAEYQIEYEKAELIYDAINTLFGLNILSDEDQIIDFLYNRIWGFETYFIGAYDVDASDVADLINSILEVVVDYAPELGLNTLIDILKFKPLELTNDKLNTYINAAADLLEAISYSKLVKAVSFDLTSAFLPNIFNGLLALHNVYNTPEELASDLRIIAGTLRIAATLDVYTFIFDEADYPLTKVSEVTGIISNILGLHYLNDEGNLDYVLEKVGEMFDIDLSNIEGDNIDLIEDSAYISKMYEYLVPVFEHELFPLKNKNSLNNLVIDIKAFTDPESLKAEIKAIHQLLQTTIIDEVGPAAILIILPMVEDMLGNYWYALDLDTYSLDDAKHDFDIIQAVIEEIYTLNTDELVEFDLELTEALPVVENIFNLLFDLELLNGNIGDVIEVVLNDFVYGMDLGFATITDGMFSFVGVDYVADKDGFITILEQAVEILNAQGVYNINQIADYIRNFTLSSRSTGLAKMR